MTVFYNSLKKVSILCFLVFAGSITKSDAAISGRYINETFLNQTNDKFPGTIPVYCYQMNFFSPDSVDINFGFEQAKFAYKKDGKKYAIINAYQGQDMYFTLNADNSITLMDDVWTGLSTASRFVSVSGEGSNWEFERILNNNTIAGEYFKFVNDNYTDSRVTFQPDGIIVGLAPYEKYTVCYSGDCTEESKEPANIVSLISSDGSMETFVFKKDKDDYSLSIYELSEPVKDIKGERTIGKKIYDLRK